MGKLKTKGKYPGVLYPKFLRYFMKEKVAYLILIVILTFIFFWRVLIHPDQILFGIDTILYYSFDKSFVSEFLRWTGEIPFWNPYSFGGKPFLGHGQEGLFYPFNLPFYLFPTDSAFRVSFLLNCMLAGLGLFFLMGTWGLSPFSSFVSAITLMFTLKFVSMIFSGHLSPITQAAWVPISFLFLELTLQRVSVGFSLLTGLVLGFGFLAGHVQILFYLFFFLFLYLLLKIFLLLRVGNWKRSFKVVFLFLLAILTFVGISSIQLFPFLEELPYLLRSEGMTYKNSGIHMSPEHLIRLLFPNYFGTPLHV